MIDYTTFVFWCSEEDKCSFTFTKFDVFMITNLLEIEKKKTIKASLMYEYAKLIA